MKYLLLFLIAGQAFAGITIDTEPFEAPHGYYFRGTGVSGTATKNTTTNIDYKLTETRKISGLHILLKDHCFADTMKLQVVDVDNILGQGAGFVADEYGTDWHVDSSNESQGRELLRYAAKIVVNLYLRLVYTSTCPTTDVSVKINYYLHRVP